MDERGWYAHQTVFLTLFFWFGGFFLCLSQLQLFVCDAIYFEGQLGKLEEVFFSHTGARSLIFHYFKAEKQSIVMDVKYNVLIVKTIYVEERYHCSLLSLSVS